MGHEARFHFEQAALGASLAAAGRAAPLPWVWNAVWVLWRDAHRVDAIFRNVSVPADLCAMAYFVHFTSGSGGLRTAKQPCARA